MHGGLLDGKPKSRELVWIMLAQRAARGALSGLYLHGNVEAVAHATEWTPRGAAGVIPVVLTRWEMTGTGEEVLSGGS